MGKKSGAINEQSKNVNEQSKLIKKKGYLQKGARQDAPPRYFLSRCPNPPSVFSQKGTHRCKPQLKNLATKVHEDKKPSLSLFPNIVCV